jgi:hypothetical protein
MRLSIQLLEKKVDGNRRNYVCQLQYGGAGIVLQAVVTASGDDYQQKDARANLEAGGRVPFDQSDCCVFPR